MGLQAEPLAVAPSKNPMRPPSRAPANHRDKARDTQERGHSTHNRGALTPERSGNCLWPPPQPCPGGPVRQPHRGLCPPVSAVLRRGPWPAHRPHLRVWAEHDAATAQAPGGAGVLVSRRLGNLRLFSFNERNPTVRNLRLFLESELGALPEDVQQHFFR